MEIEKYREGIWNRIKGRGPGSIFLNEGEDGVSIVTDLLSSLREDLNANHFVPVCIRCGVYSDPVDLWKAILNGIWQALLPLVSDGFVSEKEGLLSGLQEAEETDDVFDGVLLLLNEAREKQGYSILLIFCEAEAMIAMQSEPDAMKIRGLTADAILLTTSCKSLKELAKAKYNHTYFCNQFEPLNNEDVENE